MQDKIEQLRTYLQANGGAVPYEQFVAQIDAVDRLALVAAARKVFKFSVGFENGERKHIVSLS